MEGRANDRSSVCMVVFHLQLIRLITFVQSIGFRKYHMKDPCVIYYGVIQMIGVVGVYLQEELDTLSDRISRKLSVSHLSSSRHEAGLMIDHNNGLTLVARAHQLVMEGFSYVPPT